MSASKPIVCKDCWPNRENWNEPCPCVLSATENIRSSAFRAMTRAEDALRSVQGHGVTLPYEVEQNMTDDERRWYARGVDSQRRIANEYFACKGDQP